MTDKKLMELLVVIDDHYGRIRSKEERMADTKIYIQAFGAIPDEIVEKALYTAFTQCPPTRISLLLTGAPRSRSADRPGFPRQTTSGHRPRPPPGRLRQTCTT